METLIILIVAVIGAWGTPDPCKEHTELNDPKRSVAYEIGKDETKPLCDKYLTNGWYRFTSAAGGKIPEYAPKRFQCGTVSPIWMNGSHPAVHEGPVSRQACMNTGGETKANVTCEHSAVMGVKNCTDYFVYYLQNVPSCPMAYCAGEKKECPKGQKSATGFEPCGVVPEELVLPMLSDPQVKNKAFHFTCSLSQNNTRDPNEVFEVEFLFDGKPDPAIPMRTLSGSSMQTVLPGLAMKNHMDTNVSCRVRSYFNNQTMHVKTNWTESNKYWAGIKISPHVVVSEKGGVANVSVTSTIPILCDHDHKCCLDFILDANGPKNNVVVPHPCDQKLCGDKWNPATHSATVNFQITAAKDNVKDGNNEMHLVFDPLQPTNGGPYLDVFTAYRPGEALVHVQDADPHTCMWSGDPHFRGFDRRAFNLMDVGDFTVYKTVDFEVQTRVARCGLVGCQCGLAIHEHGDVIRIDSCRSRHHAPHVTTNGQLRQGTVVQRSSSGNHIMVYLPSGREVRVDCYPGYHNVHLTLPSTDTSGSGVCGGLTHNSVTHIGHGPGHPTHCGHGSLCPQTATWSNTPHTSLFEHVPSPTVAPTGATPPGEPHFCQCDTGLTGTPRINCTAGADVTHRTQRCGAVPCGDVTNKLPAFLGGGAGGWTKRGVQYADLDEADTGPVNLSDPGMPVSGQAAVSEADAAMACRMAMSSSQFYRICPDVANLVADMLKDCTDDVTMMKDTKFARASRDALTAECQSRLLQNVTSYNKDANGTLTLKQEFHQDNWCGDACNEHGKCVNGKCVCNTGFAGGECQLSASQPPVISKMRGPRYCDMQQRPCRKMWFDAEHFEDSAEFLCRITATTKDGSQAVTDHEAEFVSGNRLACPLPDTYGQAETDLTIAVAWDGAHFSTPQQLTVFDSVCMDCDAQGGCTHKTDACLVEGRCYSDGDVSPRDATKKCDVSASTTSWTVIQSQTKPLYPPLAGKPQLTGPDSDFLMHCKVIVDSHPPNARYRVTWYTDNYDEVGNIVLPPDMLETEFSLISLPAGSNEIFCTVRAFFEGQTQSGPVVESSHESAQFV